MKKSRIKNILVPIDFSGMSIQGIETAKRLARHFGAAIHVAHACEPPYGRGLVASAMTWGEFPAALVEETRNQLAQQLETLASRCGLSSGDKTHFREGAPVFDVICNLAAEIPADLLVVPTRASKGIKRLFLGSTAERLIQHCPCPILVDRKFPAQLSLDALPVGPALRINKILVPVDFSRCSLDGLRYAIQFAQTFAAKITLLHVLDLGYSHPMDIQATADLTRFARAAGRDAKEKMRKFIRVVKFGRVKCDTEFLIGMPVDQISDFALAQDFDLIITSTHGLTGFKHVLIGSITEHLVRQSRVPILVVPSHPEVRTANLAGAGRRPSHLGRKGQGRGNRRPKAPGRRRSRKLPRSKQPWPVR